MADRDREDVPNVPGEILDALEERYLSVPFWRVRRMADYWALCSVESQHVEKLAARHRLGSEDKKALERWWLGRLQQRVEPTVAALRAKDRERTFRTRRNRPHLRTNVIFQIWFNTIGPGGRCWFGNRYTTIRHYTFRLHWKP